MLTFVAVVFVFVLLILFHELGHFMMARYVGIKVYEFSVGFGTKVFSFKRGDTLYSLRLIPLGGYVRMAGMDPEEDAGDYDAPYSFNKKSIWQRFWVIVAGSLMNLVLAVLLLAIVFMVYGHTVPSPHIGGVAENSPAALAGLEPGDKILKVNSVPVDNWTELIEEINKSAGKEIILKFERNGVVYEKTVVPKLSEDGRYINIIGIKPDPNKATTERLNPFAAVLKGIEVTFNVSVMIVVFLSKMIAGIIEEPLDYLGGPVKIVSFIGGAAETGLFQLLQLTAFLSINVGLFNLFPIPPLDGGRLVFLLLEKLRGKPIDPAKEGFIYLIGFGLLMLFLIVLIFNDIRTLLEQAA
ncbi:RIP metalloprotease RseP [Peptococcaceae bacterium]|nr:RIP metalloprotease RseP [Peptococcaceae bacterium]